MAKKIFLPLITFFLFFLRLNSQTAGGLTSVSSSVPADLTICGNAKVFSFTINNPSPFTLTNVTVNLTMPTGIVYQVSSVSNASEVSIVPLNAPTFSLANIPTLSSVVVTFTASANCDVLGFLSSGNPIENHIKLNYTANSNSFFDNYTTGNYLIKQPNLSITTVTNQSFAGSIGGTFTRCITIVNGGLGELYAVTLKDIHGSGIQISSVNRGNWTTAAGTETFLLGAADFTTTGNNNNVFESGESITVCETITILNCSSVQSSLEASWGCGGQSCQTSISNANVVFPNFIPNLIITPQPSANVCLGVGNYSQQTLKIVNTGAGQAINTLLKIYHTSGPAYYDPSQQTEIDVASITIKVNAGAVSPLAASTTSASNNAPCLSANPIGAVDLTIPTINPGDTIRISWRTQSCCQTGYGYYNGWAYSASYQSICLNNYLVPAAWGRVYNQNYISNLVNNGSPSTLTAGQTSTFNYLLNGVQNSSPALADAYLKVTFTVSPCYVYSPGSVKIINFNGTATYTPSSVNQVGNVITAIFSGSAPFNAIMYSSLEQAQLSIDFTGNCATCVSGPGTIDIGISYSPSASCTCEMLLITSSFNLSLVCPVTCEGLNFLNYSIKRTSYGLPDNNDDGLPDGSGSLNFAALKTSRAMYGDTLTSSFYGKIKTSLAHPTWQFCYAGSTITNGNNLTSIGGKLKIFRSNALFATCTIGGVAAVLPAATFEYDLSASVLIASGGVAPGFVFLNNDSLVFEQQYKVTTNIGGAIIPAAVTNTFVVSDIANPINAINKFSCNTFQGNFSIIGYYYTNYGPDSYNVTNCNNINITQNYYLSIGPCCSNYAGGNLFPFEYRQWATIDTLEVIVPVGYQFISASFSEVRTVGTFAGAGSPGFTLTPMSTATNVFKFPINQFFTGANPLITPSDDGFYGNITLVIQPSCQVLQNVQLPINYNWKFKPGSYLNPNPAANISSTTGQDVILYNGPDIFLQSPLPNIIANTNVVTWDISLSNTSNSSAANTWFTAPVISGVTITQVVDLATSATLTPVGGIYQVGSIPAGNTQNYRLSATYTSCFADSIIVYAGWNCQGYPTSLANYPCTPKKIKLQLTPQSPLLITNVVSPPSTINLCDTAFYTVEGVNIQLGSAYSLTLTVNLPLGVTIIPGSSQLSYPAGSSFVTISNPIPIGGTFYQYNVSVLSPSIGVNGLPGILSPSLNSVKIKFKVVTSCGYTSGSPASFSFQGKSACGAPTGQLVSLSSQLGINGATAPYTTDVRLRSSYISPCNNSSVLSVCVKNLGTLSFGNTDSVTVILPQGVTYVGGSFTGINNAPVNMNPTLFTNNNQQELSWKLPPGITMGDSAKFNISYIGDPNLLSCNIFNFISKTTSSTNLYCSITGNNCGVKVYTGGDTLPIFTYKGYLTLTNQTGYSVPNPPTGETGYINFTINNSGEAINSINKTTVSYYQDVNNNGIYNVGDVLVAKDSINASIPNNGSYNYSYTLSIPSGSACNLIAVVDTAINPCACNPAQIPIILPLKHFAKDTIICSGQLANIGIAAINAYTYSWTPVTNLSSGGIANPVVTGVNASGNPESTNYVVTVNRNNCISRDTATVVVNLTPTANAGTDQNLCAIYSATLNAVTPLGILTGAWTQLSGPNVSIVTTLTLSSSQVTGLTEGTYKYIWTVSNGSCSPARDTVIVNVFNTPVANAGPDQNLCAVSSATLAAITTTGTSTGAWTQFSGPNAGTVTAPTFAASQVTGLIEGTYKFVWTVSNGNCASVADTVSVNVFNTPVSNAGVDQNLCSTYSVALAGNTPAGIATGAWTQFSGPNAGAITTTTLATSHVTGLIEGTYKLVWTVSNGSCSPAHDTVSVNVFNTPVANAGADQNLCAVSTTTLGATIPAGTSTGAWTQFSGPNPSAVTTPTLATSQVTSLIEGTYKFVWTVSNGNCASIADTVSVNVFNTPIANAGIDQNLCSTYSVALAGNAPVGTSTGAWTQFSGPNAGAITTLTLSTSPVTGLTEGTYKFIWTVSNGSCSPAHDTVMVKVFNTPVSNAGIDQNLCAVSVITAGATLPAGTSTGVWTQFSGPNIGAIATTTLATSNVSGLMEGTYKFMWTVSNGNCPSVRDTVVINVFNTPVANAGTDQNLCSTYYVILAGNAPVGTSAGVWTQFSGPNIGTIITSTLSTSQVNGLIEGTYKFVWTVSNGNCTPVHDTVMVKVFNTPVANAGADQNLCATYSVALSGNIPAGTSTGIWVQYSGPNVGAITASTLGTSHVTSLIEGTYKFVWTVSNGNCTPVHDTVIVKVFNTPVSNANANQILCAKNITTLNGNIPAGTSTGLWTPLNGGFITSPSVYNTTVTGLVSGGSYKYVWTVSNGNCTSATDTVLIEDYGLPVVNLSADVNYICEKSCVTFTDLSKQYLTDAIVKWSWDFNTGVISNLQNTIGCYGLPGVYPAVLTVTSQVGCVNSATLAGGITVYPKAIADFTIDSDNIDLTTILQFTDRSTNANIWNWNFGDGILENSLQNPTHLYTDTGKYVITLIANNQYGCSDAASLNIHVKEVAGIYIPNSFTPNDDGLNDIFYAIVRDYETFDMKVFDRWGGQIFSSNDPTIGWDGTFKGTKAKMDVYVYKIAVKFKSGKESFLTKNYIGSLTLVK